MIESTKKRLKEIEKSTKNDEMKASIKSKLTTKEVKK
jgi:hypothetical protein